MYILEIERTWKRGSSREKQTTVRLLDTDQQAAIAETVYLGDPPGIHFEPGTEFAAFRLPKSEANRNI